MEQNETTLKVTEMKKKPDKIAFLISAYTEPSSLCALVRKLDEMLCADFYIHIDKKVPIEPFQSELRDMPNVFFVNERIRVYWGGYSQVEMQLSMIREMLSKNFHYLRVINLTGMDYPIVEKEVLDEKLSNSQIEYICGFDVKNEIEPGKRKMEQKYSCFYLMDTFRILRALMIRLRIPRPFYRKFDYPLFFGSEYWALTYECISELYENFKKNKQLQKLLRFSFVPSEAWVHTMFYNSCWRDRAIHEPVVKYEGLISLSPVSFFIYTDSIKILNEEDYENVVHSGRLFARKIIKGKSDRLIAMLDQAAMASKL